MIEVHPGLFVGNLTDYDRDVRLRDGWSVVHACKEPYHRQLLGYTGRGAPKDHPEYLVARRDHRLYLNLVDADNPDYIPKEIIDQSMEFIQSQLAIGRPVLVHCNQGESRSPSIALLYLAANTNKLPTASLMEAEEAFLKLYPYYRPAPGMRGFVNRYWHEYVGTK